MTSEKRSGRVLALIQKLAANFIEREADIVGALLTVTRVEITPSFKEARIFVSVWPEKKEGEVKKFLENSQKEFYEYMKKNIKIKYMPFFEFKIDEGERARQRVEEILRKNK